MIIVGLKVSIEAFSLDVFIIAHVLVCQVQADNLHAENSME